MQLATERVHFALERRHIDIQFVWKPKKSEVVRWDGWLYASARGAKVRGTHVAARPARMRRVAFMADLYCGSVAIQCSQSPAASSQSSACEGCFEWLATGGRMLCRERCAATA